MHGAPYPVLQGVLLGEMKSHAHAFLQPLLWAPWMDNMASEQANNCKPNAFQR